MATNKVVFLLATMAVMPVSGTCPAQCTCAAVTVQCHDVSMDNFPAGVPPATEVLIISGNYTHRSKFHRLEENKLSNLKHLKTLTITHTSLDTVDEKAFQGLDTLSVIDLSFNRLTSLPANVFSGTTSLIMLHLTGNENLYLSKPVFKGLGHLLQLHMGGLALKTLDLDIFSDLASLVFLDLSDNELETLPSGIVSSSFLRNLQQLDLSYNRLTYLGNETAPLLVRVKRINLSDNPWHCTCELKWMQRFPAQIFPAAPRSQVVYCQGPSAVANRALALLDPAKLICIPPRIIHCDPVSSQSLGATFDIRCNMTGLPFPFISWKQADGNIVYGSTRKTISPQLNIKDSLVTMTLTATTGLNGTLTLMAQNVYGVGTESINITVLNPPTTTTINTATSSPSSMTKTIPTSELTTEEGGKEGDKDGGGGGGGILIYAAAGGGGAALLLSAVILGVVYKKMKNKDKVKPLEQQDKPKNNSNNKSQRQTDREDRRKNKRRDYYNDNDDVEEMDYGRANVGRGHPPPSTHHHPISAWDI